MGPSRVEVLKFGGTSMDTTTFDASAMTVARHQNDKTGLVVVVSAMAGVTKRLHAAFDDAVEGKNFEGHIEAVVGDHERLIDDIANLRDGEILKRHVYSVADEARQALKFARQAPGYMGDVVFAAGERIIAPIFGNYLQSQGIASETIDAGNVFVTDDRNGDANPHIAKTLRNVRTHVFPHLEDGRVVVMGGYYGVSENGATTTFGRGGSDRSATAMGQVLNRDIIVEGVYLYKADVGGIMSADPKKVPDARIIPHMIYKEAAALSGVGGNVLHSKAIGHVERGIPLFCRSTTNSSDSGTRIDGEILPEDGQVKVVTALRNLTHLLVQGRGMDQPGITDKISSVLASLRIDIKAISQPLSEQSMSFYFLSPDRQKGLLDALRQILVPMFRSNDLELPQLNQVTAIGIIGYGVRNPAVMAQMMQVIADTNIQATIMPPGEFEVSIRLNENGENADNVVSAIHHAYFS